MSADKSVEKDDEDELQKINEKYFEMLDMFAEWVCQLQENGNLPLNYQKRSQIYQKFQKIKNKRVIQGKKILQTLYKPSTQTNTQKDTFHQVTLEDTESF